MHAPGLCQHQQLVCVMSTMGQGLEPNEVTYSFIINAYGMAGKWEPMWKAFEQTGLEPNEFTCSSFHQAGNDGICMVIKA
jgi:pentatricopeptide repeat protein